MVRVASTLGLQEGAETLVTGDSLGQVSSRTPQPGGRRGRCSAPAAQAARRLGQGGDRSRGRGARHPRGGDPPAEDCCTLFASPLAETRAEPEKLARLEASLELDAAVEGLVAAAELVGPRLERPSRQLVPGG